MLAVTKRASDNDVWSGIVQNYSANIILYCLYNGSQRFSTMRVDRRSCIAEFFDIVLGGVWSSLSSFARFRFGL